MARLQRLRLRGDPLRDVRLSRVLAKRFGCGEVRVSFNRKLERTTERGKLRESHVTRLRTSHSKVTEAEGHVVVVGVEFGEEPCCLGIRGEEFDDRREVNGLIASSCLSLFLTVLQ